MKKDYTHITVILDRSGSMASIYDDTIGGFNNFLKQQQKEPGTATLTLVQFDSQNPYEVIHHGKPIGEVPELTRATYVPRASTPLLDAVGLAIADLDKSLGEFKVKEHPGKVIIVVVTDGRENASQKYNKDAVRKLIQEKSKKGWQFVFLSADLDSMRDARGVGIQDNASMAFEKTGQGCAEAWSALSLRTGDFRSCRKDRIEFDENDRRHPNDPNKTAK